MTMYKKTIRRETGLIEHICDHGVGHPAYASADWIARMLTDEDQGSLERAREGWMVHGCDGCCQSDEWQLASLQESVEIANSIIIQHKKLIKTMKEELL